MQKEMKASELRSKFKEITGFPLVRANAEVFVPSIGDLRRVDNLKIVVDAATKNSATPRNFDNIAKVASLEEDNKQLKKTIETQSEEQSALEEENQNLREKLLQLEDDAKAREEHDRHFTAVHQVILGQSVSDEVLATASIHCASRAELPILKAVFSCWLSIQNNHKDAYKRMSKILHPDVTRFNKELAEKSFQILNEVYTEGSRTSGSEVPKYDNDTVSDEDIASDLDGIF